MRKRCLWDPEGPRTEIHTQQYRCALWSARYISPSRGSVRNLSTTWAWYCLLLPSHWTIIMKLFPAGGIVSWGKVFHEGRRGVKRNRGGTSGDSRTSPLCETLCQIAFNTSRCTLCNCWPPTPAIRRPTPGKLSLRPAVCHFPWAN